MPKRRVLRNLVQGPDTLLERQQTLVDLGPFHPCLVVDSISAVGTAFASGEIDEAEFAVEALGVVAVAEADLEDGMGSGGVVIGSGCAWKRKCSVKR